MLADHISESQFANESVGELISLKDDSLKHTTDGGYNAHMHAGLQSCVRKFSLAAVNTASSAAPKPPSIRYCQPTVEDDLEPEINFQPSTQETESQAPPADDSDTAGALQAQGEYLIDRKTTLMRSNGEDRTSRLSNSDVDSRQPKPPSTILGGRYRIWAPPSTEGEVSYKPAILI